MTEVQAERILASISSTVADADTAMDPALAATRLDERLLAERETTYKLRTAIAEYATPSAHPLQAAVHLLPQAVDGLAADRDGRCHGRREQDRRA